MVTVDQLVKTVQRGPMRRMVKVIGLALAAIVLAFSALGLVMSRDMHVERRLELRATAAAVAAEVQDLSRWQSWAFGPEAAACTFRDASPNALRWSCGDVEGALLRTDQSPGTMWVDAQVGGRITRVRMKLSVAELPVGSLITWEEQATAPRVIGAWLRPWLEHARASEIDGALARLRARLEPDARQGP